MSDNTKDIKRGAVGIGLFILINVVCQYAALYSFGSKIGWDYQYLPPHIIPLLDLFHMVRSIAFDFGGGSPWPVSIDLSFIEIPIYGPFAFLTAWIKYHSVAPALLRPGLIISCVGFFISFIILLFSFAAKKKELTSSGTARWATDKEIRAKGLLSPVDPVKDGVICGVWDTGIPYEVRLKIAEKLSKILRIDKFKLVKLLPGKREYIVDNAPTHMLMCAPSRSGKGIGVVIPTFASWRGSMVVADPKRENLNECGAYRKYVMGHNVIEFAPADSRPTYRWNPLNEIRWGSPNEGRDVSNLVGILVGEGTGNDKHWVENAKDLIIGAVTHLKYLHAVENTKQDLHPGDEGYRETCMYDVYQFLSAGQSTKQEDEESEGNGADSNEPTGFRKTLKTELYGDEKREIKAKQHIPKGGVCFDLPNPIGTSEDSFIVVEMNRDNAGRSLHLSAEAKDALDKDGLHPVVVTKFGSFISKPENEAGSVLSTAITALLIFAEKTIVDNTIKSDFYLRDVRNSRVPTDLFLVTPPSDLQRVGKLFRLIIEFMVIKSTETLNGDKHRCLFLIDEFPAFGKMDNLVAELGYIAGYGLKTLIIIQGLEQLKKIYKDLDTLTNCQTQIFFGPNDEQTRKYVSSALGNKTIMLKQKSTTGSGMFSKKNYSYVEKQRALLLPDETSARLSNNSAMLLEGLRIYSPKNKFFLMKDMLDRFKGSQKLDKNHTIGLRPEACKRKEL